MLTCALIGYGYWGRILEKYIDADNELSLKYIYAPSLKNGIEIEYIAKDKDISCVFICTPIETHYDLARFFLLHNKHVFCEKPLSKRNSEIDSLMCLAKENHLSLYTDYIYTVSKSIQFIQENLHTIGKVTGIKGKIKQFGNFYANDDVYSVLSVHLFSAILYILKIKNLTKIQVLEELVYKKFNELIISSSLILELNDSINISLESSLTAIKKERTIEIDGEKGIILFDMLGNPTVLLQEQEQEDKGFKISNTKEVFYDETNNLSSALHNFKEVVMWDSSLLLENMNISRMVTNILEELAKE